jgi:hypothetical protein
VHEFMLSLSLPCRIITVKCVVVKKFTKSAKEEHTPCTASLPCNAAPSHALHLAVAAHVFSFELHCSQRRKRRGG